MRKFQLPKGWTRYLAPVGIGIFTVSLVIWMLFQQDAAMDRLAANYDALHAEYQSLYSEAVTEGVKPKAPEPDEIPVEEIDAPALPMVEQKELKPEPGPSGSPGARGPGPTQAQVISALATFCSTNNCKPTPTVAQVAAAISDYCAEGACVGKDGKDGKNGEDGQDAPPITADQIAAAVVAYCSDGVCRGADGVDGKQGPPPSDQQVLDQVRVYCAANNDCRGPQGDTGKTGDTGPRGVSLESVACPDDDNDDWVFTFTDGSTHTVAGPCRVTPIIPTEPEPTPTE